MASQEDDGGALKRAATADDLERQSLFSNSSFAERRSTKYGTEGKTSRVWSFTRGLIHREPVTDSMTYNSQDLASWNSLVYMSFTVWNRKSLWMTALKLMMLSAFVGIIVVASVEDPAALKVSKFDAISSFLRVFVGLLLGFFMSASVKRWWGCVEAFLGLCTTIRKMQMILCACGVSEEDAEECVRYGFLSVWMLHTELHIQALPSDKQEDARKWRWAKIRNGEGFDSNFAQIMPEEADKLERCGDPSGTLWMWIGSLMGQLAADSKFRTLPAPVFGRCMALSGEGLDKIVRVRSMITVQAPYIYVQMLSSIVHINNLVSAISFGMTSGVCLGTVLQHRGMHKLSEEKATAREAAMDVQSLIVAFFLSCFGPFVYQALLEVSIAIAQPFSNSDAIVPTKRIMKALETDLIHAAETGKDICSNKGVSRARLEKQKASQQNIDGEDDGDGDGDGDDGDDA